MSSATDILFQIAILVMSVVIHEVSHGIAAYLQGDKTAQYAGRLTLNPIPHIDLFGSILLPFLAVRFGGFFIGYAKPVPYNPYNLRNQKWGPFMVGVAGPISNLCLAILFGTILRFAAIVPSSDQWFAFLRISYFITQVNISLAVLNLLPIPPLDGSKIFHALFPVQAYRFEALMGGIGILLIFPIILLLSPVIAWISNIIFVLIVGVAI